MNEPGAGMTFSPRTQNVKAPWGPIIAASLFFLIMVAVLAEFVRPAGPSLGSLAFEILELVVATGLVLAVVIVTYRDQMSLAEAARAKLQRLSDANLMGIVITTRDGRVLEANDEYLRIVGHDRSALAIGLVTFVDAMSDSEGIEALTQAAQLGRAAPRELRIPRSDGTRVPVIAGIAALPQPGAQFVAAVLDISRQKRIEEALARHVEELARSNEELERFAYVASHDLQEPLRMITSYVQLLQRRYHGRLDADADDFIRFAVEGAHRMQDLIQDLLTYSRVGSERPRLVEASTETAFLQALEHLEGLRLERGAEVTRGVLPPVLGDQRLITQVFQNLLSNSLKFTPAGVPPRIHVSARPQQGEWVFSVADNGIGIPVEYREKVFVLFQRLHARDEYPGTGIGLSICKRIIEQHGGRIWFESEPGEGTTFYFTLPAVSGDTEAETVEPDRSAEKEVLAARASRLI
jgi:PAS domain S-box-containing protein